MSSTINTAVTKPVVIGTAAGDYSGPVYVTYSGSVEPPSSSADIGVYSSYSYSGVELTNNGTIDGGTGLPTGGSGGGSGGDAIEFTAPGGITNYGNVTGGGGGHAYMFAGSGGTGVSMGAGTLTNYGSIDGGVGAGDSFSNAGSGGTGVSIGGGTLLNHSGIGGGDGGFSPFYNAGSGGAGVSLIGGTLVNYFDGNITGGSGGNAFGDHSGGGGTGVFVENGTLTNAGSITGGGAGSAASSAGGAGTGVFLYGGTVTNTSTITGGTGVGGGVGEFVDGGKLYNYAGTAVGGQGTSIGGAGEAVISGYLHNEDATKVYGGQGTSTGGTGLYLNNYGRVDSQDTIITGGSGAEGGAGATVYGGTLYNENGSDINGGTGTDTGGIGLVLTGGSVTNTFTSNITGGGGAEGGTGASLTGGKLYNFGVITGGTGTDTGGAGVYLNGGTLNTYSGIGGGSGSGGHADSVQFGSVASTMLVGSGAAFDNDAIGGFKIGDTIDMQYLAPTAVGMDFGVSYSPAGAGVYEFQGSASGDTLTTTDEGILALTGNFSSYDFVLTPDGNNGTDITLQPVCYLRGTRIRTERGEVAIELLRIGDLVTTLSGASRPIRWIGRRSYLGDRVWGNREVLPILIRQGAIARNVPSRDLWVSPEHAMYIDGMLIPAALLVNGVSIVQEERVDEVTYFHLEFDTHEVIVAEAALAESFVDDESRQLFDNASEYHELYPQPASQPARFCAPRVEDGYELETVRQRLMTRAESGRSASGADALAYRNRVAAGSAQLRL
jgi:Hint domain-containing protein